jgi:hypothetical protein
MLHFAYGSSTSRALTGVREKENRDDDPAATVAGLQYGLRRKTVANDCRHCRQKSV